MHDSKVRSRLKAQLTKFSAELCGGLSKPLTRFVSQMLFGIQSSQDVKLSNIARSLQEDISLIRTEKRLSRNLKSAELEKELTPQLVRMGSLRVQPNTVLALDLSDIRKEYAQKMASSEEFVGDFGDHGPSALAQRMTDLRSPKVQQPRAVFPFFVTRSSFPNHFLFPIDNAAAWRLHFSPRRGRAGPV